MFCQCGFDKLLILHFQLRSAVLGWSTNIYLQANLASTATYFYAYLEFKRAPRNHIKKLPLDWQYLVKTTNITGFTLNLLIMIVIKN